METQNENVTEKELTPAELAKTYPHFIQYDKWNVSIKISVETKTFYEDVSNLDVLRYLKNVFTNKKRFISRFINPIRDIKNQTVDFDATVDLSIFNIDDMLDYLVDNYDDAKPFTYTETFKLVNEEFMSKVFGSINIVEMISELGHERIATEGKHLRHKQYSKEGEFLGYVEYDVIYETHKVDGSKLELNGDVYALKCWCTTTNKEHWLWIDEEFKDDPLSAIAQTFEVHSSVLPHVIEMKRQGDILLVELDEDVTPTEDDELIPLTKEQYFGFLSAQS